MPFLVPLTVAGCSRAMAAGKERSLHLSQTLGDRDVLDGSLDAGGGSVVAAALRLAPSDDGDVARTPATRRADALVEVCRFFLDHQQSQSAGCHRPHVNVVLDLEAFEAGGGGRVVGGPSLDQATVSRLLCDRALHRVLWPAARPSSTAARRRAPSPPPVERPGHQRRALRFPGCDRPSGRCDSHHIVWVTDGGPRQAAGGRDGHRDRSLWPRMFDVPAASLARVARSARGATRPCGDRRSPGLLALDA